MGCFCEISGIILCSYFDLSSFFFSSDAAELIGKKIEWIFKEDYFGKEASSVVSEEQYWGNDEVSQHDTIVSTWKPQQDLPTALCEPL